MREGLETHNHAATLLSLPKLKVTAPDLSLIEEDSFGICVFSSFHVERIIEFEMLFAKF